MVQAYELIDPHQVWRRYKQVDIGPCGTEEHPHFVLPDDTCADCGAPLMVKWTKAGVESAMPQEIRDYIDSNREHQRSLFRKLKSRA